MTIRCGDCYTLVDVWGKCECDVIPTATCESCGWETPEAETVTILDTQEIFCKECAKETEEDE